MPKRYSSAELIEIVEKDGWYQISKRGSHLKFKHLKKSGVIIIPHPKKDIPTGTAQKILKMAGLK
jgi:predicted RNA binding protein YcfA (HicA-like mRNA interferase family)